MQKELEDDFNHDYANGDAEAAANFVDRLDASEFMTLAEVHEFLMDLRDEIEGKISGSTYNRLDDCIDALANEIGVEE